MAPQTLPEHGHFNSVALQAICNELLMSSTMSLCKQDYRVISNYFISQKIYIGDFEKESEVTQDFGVTWVQELRIETSSGIM